MTANEHVFLSMSGRKRPDISMTTQEYVFLSLTGRKRSDISLTVQKQFFSEMGWRGDRRITENKLNLY